MIVRIRGEVLEVTGQTVTVEAGGLGYEVFMPVSSLARLQRGDQVDLPLRQITREDGSSLYGFSDLTERTVFDLLTQVKGCGAKIALAALGSLGAEGVCICIGSQDAKGLARTPGIGPRLAERIIVELKDKVGEVASGVRVTSLPTITASVTAPEDELLAALMSLGYRRGDAERAASTADPEAPIEERLRQALKAMR